MCKDCENDVKENKEKIRKVFLNDLPRKDGVGVNKGKLVIDWGRSIGYKVKFQYEDKEGEVEIIKYNSKTRCLEIKYKDKNIYNIGIDTLKKCKLGKILGIYTHEFKIEIGQRFKDDKRDIIVIDREYRRIEKIQNYKWYKYKCNKCGWDEGWIEESNLLKGIGCSCCHGFIVIEGINDIPTTAPWMVKYFQGSYDEAKKYTKNSNQKIFSICPECGRIKNKTISILNIYYDKSIGCECSDGKSYPEKLMFNILEQLNVYFETEYSPDWIKPKRYDFYFEINNKKYIVETDGEFHSQDNLMNGQTCKRSKEIDDEKDKLADEHNVEVIRINCYESDLDYIKNNILNSKLYKLFDLSIIDWSLAEEFALSNLVKKACEIKRENPDITTTEIGKIMNLNKVTIIKYLKQGSKLGWCNYDSKEERKKTLSKGSKSKSRKIKMFKDNKLLGIFESVSELTRQSVELFGVKLLNSNISSVCNNKRKLYKGFTFRYID